jgi:hypothetical protein
VVLRHGGVVVDHPLLPHRRALCWACMNPDLGADYFVAVERGKFSWTWQLHRRSRPLGVKVIGRPFRTEQAAKLAGEKALRDFLEQLNHEASRPPK